MTDIVLTLVLLAVCFGVGLVITFLLVLSIVQKIFGRYKGGEG
jgi:hypothetical protein